MSGTPSRDPFRLVFAFCVAQWRRQIKLTAAIVIAMLLATICESVIPLFAGRLVDALTLKAGAADAAVRAVLSIFVLGLVAQAFRYAAFRGLSSASTRIMQRIVADAFYRVQRFSTDWHASSFAGATVRKITRGMWAYDTLADTILLGFFPASVMLVAVTAILAAHWVVMGLAVAVGATVYIAIASVLTVRYVAPAAQQANEADSRLGAAVADSIGCNSLVKSFAGEAREDARLGIATDLWRGRTYKTWLRGTLSGTSQGAVVVALQAAVLCLAVWLWTRGLATAGDIAYVLATYTVIQGYLRDIALHIRNLQRSVNDMEDVALFARQPLGVEDRPGAKLFRPGRGEIAFDRVTFRYRGQANPLYRDFSLLLRGGERVGLVGASGSGKSTFVKLIQRLHDIDGGEIRIDGQNVAALTQESLRQAISLVPQDPLLFHRSLGENIAYGRPGASRDEIVAAATRAHAHDFIMALPQGYDTLVGERGSSLSGGQRQRIAIARALVTDPRILIFDEATSALDYESERIIQDNMQKICERRTVFVIAHRLSTVRRADRIITVERGRIIEDGTHDELMGSKGSYANLHYLQAGIQ